MVCLYRRLTWLLMAVALTQTHSTFIYLFIFWIMWNGWDLHGSNGEMTIRWKVFRYFAILPTFRKMCLCSISIPNESLKLYTREWAKREKNTALTCDAFVIFMPNWNLLHTSKSIYDFWSWPWKKVTLTKNKTKARIWKNAHTNFGYAHDMSAFMFVSHNKDGIS